MQTLPRKDQIRQKAQILFRERGYAATSMRDLAETMGMEAASLYNHISSKEEILQQICFGMAEAFFAAIESVAELEVPAKEKLRTAINAHLRVIAANADASAVFLHEWRHIGEPFLSDFKIMRRRYEGIFRAIIEEGIASGEFRIMDADLAARTILSATNWTYESYKSSKSAAADSTASVAEQLTDLLMAGITK
jgi:AcrR family transcriptional regulator